MSDDSLTRLWVQWLGKLGNYDLGSEDIINQLLGEKEGGARKKLYEGMESITESCMARLKFYNFIINKYPDTSNQKNFKAQSIKMAELLEGDLNGESGLELYKAACAEENNTQAFRNAVFMASTKTYDGPTWLKRLMVWVGGPSASGKSFGTDNLIKLISKNFQIVEEKNEDNQKNYVITIDGGVERQMSQVRQMALQIALAEGYSDIQDLEECSKNLKTKKYILNAALEAQLNIVIPSTFTQGLAKQEKLMKEASADPNNEVIFTQVRGAPSDEGFQQFKKAVKIMGTTRAARLFLPYAGTAEKKDLLSPNNRDIGIESKAYNENVFDYGIKKSNEAREKFREVCEKYNRDFYKNYYEITNDLVFVQERIPGSGKWVELTNTDDLTNPAIVRTNRRVLNKLELLKQPISGLCPDDFITEVILFKDKTSDKWILAKDKNGNNSPSLNVIKVSLAAFKISGQNIENDWNKGFNKAYDVTKFKQSIIHSGEEIVTKRLRAEDQKDANEEKINVMVAGVQGMKKVGTAPGKITPALCNEVERTDNLPKNHQTKKLKRSMSQSVIHSSCSLDKVFSAQHRVHLFSTLKNIPYTQNMFLDSPVTHNLCIKLKS